MCRKLLGVSNSYSSTLQNQIIGCFNHRVVTMVADKQVLASEVCGNCQSRHHYLVVMFVAIVSHEHHYLVASEVCGNCQSRTSLPGS